jgi:hypothetical protein
MSNTGQVVCVDAVNCGFGLSRLSTLIAEAAVSC